MDKLKYVKLENPDGSYSSSIPLAVNSDYVDINGESLSDVLTTKADIQTVNMQVDNLQSEINSLASGSPKGNYETVAALISANPDTGVYIITTDGHIYSWTKNSSSAIDLGVYQSTGIADNSINTLSLNKNVTHNIINSNIEMNSRISKKEYNIKLTMDDLEIGKYMNSSGQISTVSHTKNILTKMIAIPNNIDFHAILDFDDHTNMRLCAYDENYNFISNYELDPSQNLFPGSNIIKSIIPYNARYFRFQITNSSTPYESYVPYLSKIHISISQYVSEYDFEYKKNLVDRYQCVDGFIQSLGNLTTLEQYKTSEPIFVKPGILYFSNMRAYYLMTLNGTCVYNNEPEESYDNRYVTITEDSIIIFSYLKNKDASIMMCYVDNINEIPEYEPCRLVSKTPIYIEDQLYPKEVDNSISLNGIYKKEILINAYWTVDDNGKLIEHSTPIDWNFSAYYCLNVLCNSTQKIMYKGRSTTSYPGIIFFNENYESISTLYMDSSNEYTEVNIPNQTKYALIQGSAARNFDFYIIDTSPLIKADRVNKGYDYDSILTNKNWTVCGDSFTYGDFSGASIEENTFTEGIYAGKRKVYAYYIGNRTNVKVNMLAKNGMTLASVEGRNNCFVEGVYQTIPSDADYITLYFGINDINTAVPIGDNDSTDPTTFKGAWNIVLTWLRNNRPFAHVGLVVTNKSASYPEYFEAIRVMAKKYGYPALDLEKDTKLPYILNCQERDGLDPDIKALVNTQCRVGENNGHPSAQAHKFISNIIENFLHEI